MGINPCSAIHWMASNTVEGKDVPSWKPTAGEGRLLVLPDIIPAGRESPGMAPVNTGAPLSAFALDTMCQLNLKKHFFKRGLME